MSWKIQNHLWFQNAWEFLKILISYPWVPKADASLEFGNITQWEIELPGACNDYSQKYLVNRTQYNPNDKGRIQIDF